MNRERKYRAWHPEFKEMIYSHDEPVWDKREFFLMCFPVGFSHYPQDDRWIIMDWTGFKDNTGKEIYQDDILKTFHFRDGKKDHYLYHRVMWDSKYGCWKAVSIGNVDENINTSGNPQLWVYIKNSQPFEIVGNVYEHPKLMPQQPTTESNT